MKPEEINTTNGDIPQKMRNFQSPKTTEMNSRVIENA
jgi:hypothetical protein